MRKLCVVTGTRAEYGLAKSLLSLIVGDPSFALQLVVTGSHLSPEFGSTYKQIEEDGYSIAKRVDILLSSGSPIGVAKAMGLASIGFAEAFDELKPDLMVLVGDRFETFVAAQVATVLSIPIAHIHGGERTEGAIDEAFRHAITKMSHIHFVSADEYGKRVVQLGENPDRVFVVGAPGLDLIRQMDFISQEQLERDLGLPIRTPLILGTYHPVTLEGESTEWCVQQFVAALRAFPEATIVLTYPNSDPHSFRIFQALRDFAESSPNVVLTPSLGSKRYLSVLRLADAVVGNSSSGIIEAPFVGTPTVNIGKRQRGRVAGPSVLHCSERWDSIAEALKDAISRKLTMKGGASDSLYGDGYAAQKILNQLKSLSTGNLLMKEFYDLKIEG
jgi:UDP-hydrolysing UDP-N-acetyl-D-glucosamine 2-epimerase